MTFVSLTRIKELQQESSRLIKEFGYKYLLEISFQELKKQKFSILSSTPYSLQPKYDADVAYSSWLTQYNEKQILSDFPQLKLLIVVEWDNSKNNFLKTVNSVIDQNYTNLKLLLINSPKNEFNNNDQIISLTYDELKSFLEKEPFDFLGFLLSGDVLHTNALLEINDFLHRNNSKILYTDHDEIDKKNKRNNPFFKPNWSSYLLLHYNYIQRFFLIQKNIFSKYGVPKSFSEIGLYDFILNVSKDIDGVEHLPLPLCSVRTPPSNDYKQMISDNLKNLGYDATVEDGIISRTHKIDFVFNQNPKISIIIPTKNNKNFLKHCIETLEEKTTYSNYEIIIVDNNSDDETQSYLKSLQHTILIFKDNFNFSKMCNLGSEHSTGDYLLFLNDDTWIIQENWLEELVKICSQNEVGAVGPKLLYPNYTIQHAGMVLLSSLSGFHPFQNIHDNNPGYHNLANVTRECSAVTGACLLVKKDVFDAIGGWDVKLDVYYGDTDLCLKIQEKGFKIIYTPNSKLIHNASSSIKKSSDIFISVENHTVFSKRWKNLTNGDPYYNPNLNWNYQIKIN